MLYCWFALKPLLILFCFVEEIIEKYLIRQYASENLYYEIMDFFDDPK